MIKVEGIKKKYGDILVLNNISLQLEEKKIIAIVGASGAGKSTLLHIIGTLDKPDSGSIIIDGIDISKLSENKLAKLRNQKIGFIFQFHHLLPEFTALENISLPALINGSNKKTSAHKALELLTIMGLEDRAHHKPNQLSGGEQQRVAVARALINNPKYVFADEPTGNLDSKNADSLHKTFFELNEKFEIGFIIVTHNNELAKSAHQLITMEKGRII